MPANEHFTMQLARQVFRIAAAECAVVFFKDDPVPAYLTRRFDISADGQRLRQEDFYRIAGIADETGGKNYKYEVSYEKIAVLKVVNGALPCYLH